MIGDWYGNSTLLGWGVLFAGHEFRGRPFMELGITWLEMVLSHS